MKNFIKSLLLITCAAAFSQEAPPVSTDNSNWVSSISYDITGKTLSKSVGFYNTLGKPTQSQSWDILSKKVWGSETLYDYHGRPALQTLSAPINTTSSFSYDASFIRDSNSDYTLSDFDLGITLDNPKPVSSTSKLGGYYWNSSANEYQDNTAYPFSRTVYSKLNPGSGKKALGGNKINGEWKQSYSFSMVSGTELSTALAFGNSATEYDTMRVTKTVSRDVHGVEVVVFTDSDGNTLAAARSGNEEQSGTPVQNTVTIKEQGYVDIHIPYNCTGISIQNPETIALRIYDLVTENPINSISGNIGNYSLSPGFYRIAVLHPETYEYNYELPLSITHTVNYFNYALNYYDKAGRLLEATQPNSSNLKSTFRYNTLGQLLETTSPDEGTAQFIYRKDGQVRFSQNSKQQENNAFSYTNYDRLGRPIESGEYRGSDIVFYLADDTAITSPPIDTTPYTITLTNNTNVETYSGPPRYYRKASTSGQWDAGFASQEVIEENGKVTFKSGVGSGPSPFGNYAVVLGLSPITDAPNPSYTTIKYGIKLDNTSGFNVVNIHENGDFLRDTSSQIINYGSYVDSDVFAVERTNGVITYLKNDVVFHTTSDNYLEPLTVDASFQYNYNAINSVIVSESNATPSTPSGTNIQNLVNVQDGLNDANCYEQHFTLYDMPASDLSGALTLCGLPLQNYKQTFLSGNVSKTYTNSPETTTSWYSYDVYGRVKWIVQKIMNLDCVKTIDYTYDAVTGQVVKVDYQKYESSERFIHQYEYNVGSQLVKVSTSLNDEEYIEQAEYAYNETGQLIRTELADNLQGIDYIYNLQGQLKAINHPSLDPAKDPGHDGGTNGFASDVFGMAVKYYDGDYTRTTTPTPLSTVNASTPSQFNGNIQAIEWQNENGQPSTYAYEYNKNNWLKQADFYSSSSFNGEETTPTHLELQSIITSATNVQATSTITLKPGFGAAATNSVSFKAEIIEGSTTYGADDYDVSNITYDANGNIQTLKRNGVTNASGSNAMDNFTYHYNSKNNQLEKVTDASDNPDPTRYNDLKNQADDNYVYNAIGQLVLSKQDKALYEYNASGLVTKINELTSTDTGNYYKLLEEDYNSLASLQVSQGLQWSALGSLPRGVIANQADQYDEYSGLMPLEVTDPADIKVPDYCVAFDNDTNYKNRYQFNFYSAVRPVANTYTLQTNVSTIANAYHNLSFDLLVLQKQYLKATTSNPTGVSNMNAGATIRIKQLDGTLINTYVINTNTQSYCDRVVDHVNFSFLATDSKVSIEIDIVNNGENPTGYIGKPSGTYKQLYQSAEVDNFKLEVASSAKVAYFYNDRGQRVKKETYTGTELVQTIYVQDVAGSPMGIYYRAGGTELKLAENPIYGASRIGVFNRDNSTSSGNYVYQLTDHLGNVRAVIAKSGTNAVSLTQKTDYYPFGMPMPNRNVEGGYRYGYQGEFAEKDPETGLNAFELRLWDSRIGRWLSPDPMHEFHSPYLGMGNNPISLTDPTGGSTDPDPPCTTCGGDNGASMMEGISLDEVVIGGNNINSAWSSEITEYGGSFNDWHLANPQFSSNPALALDQWGVSHGSDYAAWSHQAGLDAWSRESAERMVNAFTFGAMMWGMGANYNIGVRALPTRSFNFKGIVGKSNAPVGDDIALGLNDNLFSFAKANGFKTYRDFSVGLQVDKINAAMHSPVNRLHFNLDGFSRFQYLKFRPGGNIGHGNVTNWELNSILNNASLLRRTTFYRFGSPASAPSF